MKSTLVCCMAALIGVALIGGCATTSRVTSVESHVIEKNVKLTNVSVTALPVRLNPGTQPLVVDPSSEWISGEVSRTAAEVVDLLRQRGIRSFIVVAGEGESETPEHVLLFSVPRAMKQTASNFYRKTKTETLVSYEVVLQVLDPVRKKTVWKGQASMNVGAEDTAKPLAREFLELLQKDSLI